MGAPGKTRFFDGRICSEYGTVFSVQMCIALSEELPLFCTICGGIPCYRTFLGTSKCPRVSWKSLAIPFNFLKNDRPHVIKSDQL